jgi:diaminohydroxyphosphoribosylaminopyrimidine deaminase/5-amino-6-(5-phosphoribosylamino)uracil reductase
MRQLKASQNESLWMMRAIQLAEKGRGRVEPNPLVGAIVFDARGRMVSEEYHGKFGGPHAEVKALTLAGRKALGGTLFITLEPCSTYGKTPPCTDKILQSGVTKVVIGSVDPNPRHRGRGIRILKKGGINVKTGLLHDLIQKQNSRFFKFIKTGIPYVTLKLAQSLDGKIATSLGESKWITSRESRKKVQELRSHNEAILVGTNTLKLDEPMLRLRHQGGRHPRRIFIVRKPDQFRKYLMARDEKRDILFFQKSFCFRLKNTQVIKAPFNRKGILISFLLKRLSKEGISSLLVEGGGEMAASFLEGNWVDQVYFFIAPVIIGGRGAKTGVEGKGVKSLQHALHLKDPKVERLGEDVLIYGELK